MVFIRARYLYTRGQAEAAAAERVLVDGAAAVDEPAHEFEPARRPPAARAFFFYLGIADGMSVAQV